MDNNIQQLPDVIWQMMTSVINTTAEETAGLCKNESRENLKSIKIAVTIVAFAA